MPELDPFYQRFIESLASVREAQTEKVDAPFHRTGPEKLGGTLLRNFFAEIGTEQIPSINDTPIILINHDEIEGQVALSTQNGALYFSTEFTLGNPHNAISTVIETDNKGNVITTSVDPNPTLAYQIGTVANLELAAAYDYPEEAAKRFEAIPALKQ